ncbi:Rha family transcriptional regulator [Streptococcus pluranimalium]|uniref:Rha family transcriptional regulator n=1 Tax=Streptococcus pluranimalium TaxID=82348 RepID=UPI0039FBAF4C
MINTDDGTQYISSRSVAEWTEKQHSHLNREIETYISYLTDDDQNPILDSGLTMRIESYFVEDTYQSEKGGRSYKFYWCSRKGCELIANKMTGKKGLRFSAQYIEAFHSMEQALKEVPTPSTESISEPKKQIEESPELTYIQTKLKDISQLTDFTAIDEGLRQVSSFIKMVIPNK